MTLPKSWNFAVIVLSNALPLLGVFMLGWDIYTLLIFYWLETAVIAFWTVLTLAFNIGDPVLRSQNGSAASQGPGSFVGVIVLLHSGAFLAIHLYLVSSLYGGNWPGHLDSPARFVQTFVFEQKLWPMLAFIFIHRGVIFLEDRRQEDVTPLVYGLYARIVVMQVVIIVGAWGVLMLGSGLFGLVLLVGMRTALDLFWPQILTYAIRVGTKPS
ncbi:MAG: hypothetical protein GX970_11950 [Phyllobacteriaceae bacterium]|nr:hypothetical protein [Phyllobacteriaceae bacterium]